jgi:hypothetical protein
MKRAEVTRASLRPTLGAARLEPTALACVLGCIPLLIARPDEVAGALLATTLITAFGVGFALDDPAAETLESSPTTLLSRRGLRVALLMVLLTLGTLVQLTVARFAAGGRPLPIAAWLLEHSAFVATTLAVSAFAQRVLPERRGGAAAAATGLVLLFGVTAVMQLDGWLTPIPGANHWPRWSWILAVAIVVLATLTRDPAHPACHRRPGPRRD